MPNTTESLFFRLLLALLGTSLCVAAPGTYAEPIAVGATNDAYVFSQQPNTTFNSGELALKADVNFFSRKAWLSFDVSSLGLDNAGTTVDSASLSLTKRANGAYSNQTLVFNVYGLTDESLDVWSETTLTWNNAPGNSATVSGVNSSITTLLGQFSFFDSPAADDLQFSIQGEPLIDFLLADTNGLLTMIITRSTFNVLSTSFYSRESGIPSSTAPTLSVSVSRASVPLPTSASLFLAGLPALFWRGKREVTERGKRKPGSITNTAR